MEPSYCYIDLCLEAHLHHIKNLVTVKDYLDILRYYVIIAKCQNNEICYYTMSYDTRLLLSTSKILYRYSDIFRYVVILRYYLIYYFLCGANWLP